MMLTTSLMVSPTTCNHSNNYASSVSATSSILPQEPPIHWEEDEDIFISEGDEYLTYELHYGSPCPMLSRHPANNSPRQTFNYQPQVNPPNRPSMQPYPHAANIPAPITSPGELYPMGRGHPRISNPPPPNDMEPDDDEDLPPQNEEQPILLIKRGILSHYQQQCENIFREIITSSVIRFRGENNLPSIAATRVKRQWEFITGFAVSNILTTAKDWLMTRSESKLEDRLVNAEHRIVAMNSQQDLLALSQKAMAKTLTLEQKEINQIQKQVSQIADITAFLDYFIGEMQQVRSKHDRLLNSIRNRNPDLTTISELFDTPYFGRLQVRDIEQIYVDNPHVNVLKIRMVGPIRSKNALVYDVVSFPYYTNFTGKSGFKKEYNGNLRVMYNKTSDCVRGLGTSASRKYVQDTCPWSNYRDAYLRDWKTTFIPDVKKEDFRPIAHVVWPNMKIQCYSRNITIIGARNKSTTTSCPMYVFKLDLASTFSTSDGIINHASKGTKTVLRSPTMIMDVMDYHDENFKPIHKELEDSLKHTEELIQQQEKERNATTLFTVNGSVISYHLASYVIVISVLAVNVFLIANFCYRRRMGIPRPANCTSNSQGATVARNVGADSLAIHAVQAKIEEQQLHQAEQLAEQNSKLDLLLKTASEIDARSDVTRKSRRVRSPIEYRRDVTRQIRISPERDLIRYTVVPTIFDAGREM